MRLPAIKYLFLLAIVCIINRSSIISQTRPEVYSIDPNELIRTKELISSKSSEVMPAYKQLIKEAEKFLKKEPYSVMNKDKAGASGDKHDYFSLSIYSWPNPKTKDGLPYITKDGHVNPESQKGTDAGPMVQMCDGAFILALAYYFTGSEKYAEHAAQFLKTWFIDPSTKMNPNLNYAQAVPGKNDGSFGGIIDSRNFINVTEAAGLIEGSKSWTSSDRKNLAAWFNDFLNWLLTSENGIEEGKTTNNHVTFYSAQVVNYALFSGNKDEANKVLESVKDLIASQIEPDGTQPLELKRTKAFSYSVFNLQAFFLLGEMGINSGVDLYNYQTNDGRSIRKAFDYIAPYADTTKHWPHDEEINSKTGGKYWLAELLQIASVRYPDGNYQSILNGNYNESVREKNWFLLYPVK
jgi:hypothetical protein